MLKYDSIKDFINQNYIRTITKGILDYTNTRTDNSIPPVLTKPTLLTLAWRKFDHGVLTMSVGTSAVLTDVAGNHTSTHYYNIIIHGNVLKHLSDLCVDNIEEVDELLLQEETAMSLFGLPEISSSQLEERAKDLYTRLCEGIKKDDENRFCFPVIAIKEKLGMKLWPADLPDNCCGRLYLKPSTATIYDPMHIDYPNENVAIPRGTILLNRRYFTNDIAPDDIITAAHELVHWSLHQLYFLVMQILDDGFNVMNCTSEPMVLDDGMTMQEKAYFYAEWQANELSVRLSMPRHLVAIAVTEYEEKKFTSTKDGHYYENMVYALSWEFNVPPIIMKERLRQLGYDFVDGGLVKVNGTLHPPFSFVHGSLEANETFVIDRIHYEQLLRGDAYFAGLIESMRYIYTGAVVCRLDAKYLKVEGKQFVLSDYGSTHVDECCLRFKHNHQIPIKMDDDNEKSTYFCRLYTEKDYYNSNNDGDFVLSTAARLDVEAFIGHYQIIEDMNKNGIVTLHDALHYHKKRKKLTYDQIADLSGLSRGVIDSYFAKQGTRKYRKIPLEKLMILCNVFELEETIALDLLRRASYALNELELKGQYYRYLLTITNAPLEVWNHHLKNAGFEPFS